MGDSDNAESSPQHTTAPVLPVQVARQINGANELWLAVALTRENPVYYVQYALGGGHSGGASAGAGAAPPV